MAPARSGEKGKIMKNLTFTKIEGASGTLDELGVRWAGTTIQMDETIRRDIGENRMNDYTDDLCSYDGPLYLGSDGKLYIVEFIFRYEGFRPACWMPVEPVSGLPVSVNYAILVDGAYIQSVSVEYGTVSVNPLTNWAMRFKTQEDAIGEIAEIEYHFPEKFRKGSLHPVLILN